MKARSTAIVILGVLVVAAAIWLFMRRMSSDLARSESGSASETAPSQISSSVAAAPSTSSALVQKPGGPYEPSDPRWKWWNEMSKSDPGFQWKMPIEFYGKVVDEQQRPVSGAKFEIVGTDASLSGNFFRTLISDPNGMVSLSGLRGKQFGVLISKDGYYRSQTNRRSFEYAAFFNPDFYQPDPNNPVIFHLRKKGQPASLISSEGKLILNFGAPSVIPMSQESGIVSQIEVTVYENNVKTGKWKARISMGGGGIQPTTEEFPFEAPVGDYQNSIDLDQGSPQPPGWQNDQGGQFYIKTSIGYGLLELRQTVGKKTLHYKVLSNSNGGTNLEPASNQQ